MSVLVAVCQFAPFASTEANRARVGELVAEAACRRARLVVLPEYSSYFIDPMDASFAENAEGLDGPFVQALRQAASVHGVTIVAGLIENAGEKVSNTLIAVDATGLRTTYRKQHLYDAFGQSESDWIVPGALDEPQTFEVDGIRFGLMTCYDLRFPEVARALVDVGVDAIVVPAEWVRGPLKEHHWTTLLATRAIENTAYVVAADHPAPIGVGRSQIVDPQGVVLAGLASDEGIALAELDRGEIERVRGVNPVLQLRRYRVVPR